MKNPLWIVTLGLIVLLAGCGRPPAAGPAVGAAAPERVVAYYADPMNPSHTYDHPGKAPCGMDLVPVYVTDRNFAGIKIDPAATQNIGVTSEPVQRREITREIKTSGAVAADETRLYVINAKVAGWAEKLDVTYTGAAVRRGQPLLELYSPDLVSTQEEYLQALRYARSLSAGADPRARRGARELAESARQRLENWDIPRSEIAAVAARGRTQRTMTLVAPAAGVVVDKPVEAGKAVEAGQPLYKIADLSRVWVLVDLYQEDLAFVKTGQSVRVTPSYLPGRVFHGRVSFISPVLDPETKTAQARIVVLNTPTQDLKPGMFAEVLIASPVKFQAVAIPEQAVIHTGKRNVAVVSLGNGYFAAREVQLGVSGGGYVQVVKGLEEGEKLVTSSQFLIDADSNLKAAIQNLGQHADEGSATEAMPGMPGMTMPAGAPQESTPTAE